MKILKRLKTGIDIAITEDDNGEHAVMVVTMSLDGNVTSSSNKLYSGEPSKEELSEQLHQCLALHAMGMAKTMGAK